MAKQVLFVQGGGEGAHAEDAALVASLEEKLGRNYRVYYPAMPREADPDYPAGSSAFPRRWQSWAVLPSSWVIRSARQW